MAIKIKLSFWRKIKIKLRFDGTRCRKCYGRLNPIGYHYTECKNCGNKVYWVFGNLADDGKGYKYDE